MAKIPGSVENTRTHLDDYTVRAKQLADDLVDERVSLEAARGTLDLLRREFGFARAALSDHQQKEELKLGEFDYLVARSYVGETPAHVAYAAATLAAEGKKGAGGDATWIQFSDKELPVVERLIVEAREWIDSARRDTWWIARTFSMLRLVIFTKRQVTPLGYGDMSFMLQSAAAATRQLVATSKMATFRFTPGAVRPADNALYTDPQRALETATELFKSICNGNHKAGDVIETLPTAAGLALVEAESQVARHRLSRASMLARSKVSLLAAAICMAQLDMIRRATDTPGCKTRLRLATNLEEERLNTTLLIQAYFRGAQSTARRARKLRFHDLIWGKLKADLGLDLGKFAVLPSYGQLDVEQAIAKLNAIFLATNAPK